MAYDGSWNSTDQVPERAITEGLINRYGTLAPPMVASPAATACPSTASNARTLTRSSTRLCDQVQTEPMVDVHLRPVRSGLWRPDAAARQPRGLRRQISKSWFGDFRGMQMTNVLGAQTRIDDIKDVGIDHTYHREILFSYQDASVVESNAAVYYENTLKWQPWLRTVPGSARGRIRFRCLGQDARRGRYLQHHHRSAGLQHRRRTRKYLQPKAGALLSDRGALTPST